MKSNQLDTFKSHLIRLIKEELEGGEDEKQAGLEKALYDTAVSYTHLTLPTNREV